MYWDKAGKKHNAKQKMKLNTCYESSKKYIAITSYDIKLTWSVREMQPLSGV